MSYLMLDKFHQTIVFRVQHPSPYMEKIDLIISHIFNDIKSPPLSPDNDSPHK